MTVITPGTRLYSATSTAEVIVVKGADVDVHCAGQPMLTARPAEAPSPTGTSDGLAVGKRYIDDPSGLLLLCTRAGAGPVTVDGRPIQPMQTKALPSSD